jgi:uncharacterized membrane protein YeaQ/YmgE (transglycosylase-associated protein family)
MLELHSILAAGLFETRGLIGTLVVGLIVGAIAKLLMPGKDPGGCIVTILLGLAGAFIGGLIGSLFRADYRVGWIMSVVGAMLLLFIYRMVVGRRGKG